jgi:hypothetical protein
MEIFQRIGAVEAAGVSAEVDGHRVAASSRPDHDTRRPAVRRTGLWSPGNDDREAVTDRDLKVTANPGGPLPFAVRA